MRNQTIIINNDYYVVHGAITIDDTLQSSIWERKVPALGHIIPDHQPGWLGFMGAGIHSIDGQHVAYPCFKVILEPADNTLYA